MYLLWWLICITKKYFCHVNIILYPHGWNIHIYVENIWFPWQKCSSMILHCSQKFNSLFTSTPLMLMRSHDSYIRLGIKGQSKGWRNKHVENNMEITISREMGEEVDTTINTYGIHVTRTSRITYENWIRAIARFIITIPRTLKTIKHVLQPLISKNQRQN